jgi:DNA/RNA endonuclease YhcR with UshA esterase domain
MKPLPPPSQASIPPNPDSKNTTEEYTRQLPVVSCALDDIEREGHGVVFTSLQDGTGPVEIRIDDKSILVVRSLLMKVIAAHGD